VTETFAQYIARIESYVAGQDPLAVLRKTPKTLARAVASAPMRRIRARPDSKKWSAGEILAHLADLELLWGCRMRLILGQSGVPIVGMDQDVWARSADYPSIGPRRSLAAFTAIRRANLDLLDRLSPAQRKRWGAHSQFGRLTITRLTRLLAGHDVNHLRQVQARLSPRRATLRATRD
jgi:DinB superfamily